jgi:hypothetical protein
MVMLYVNVKILPSPEHLLAQRTPQTDNKMSTLDMLVEVGGLVADIAAVLALPPLFPVLPHRLTHFELYQAVQAYKNGTKMRISHGAAADGYFIQMLVSQKNYELGLSFRMKMLHMLSEQTVCGEG